MSRKETSARPLDRLTRLKRDKGRSTAEWVTLSLSLAIVAGLVALVVYLSWIEGDQPTVVEVRPRLDDVLVEAGGFYVPIDITNRGERAVGDLWIRMSLAHGEAERDVAQFNLQFLEGGQTVRGVVVFREDPAQGELSSTLSFTEP